MGALSRAIATALAGTLLVLAPSARAQDFPARRITIVVPFSPGTTFDLIARTLGQRITERYGQPVMVDNKPGASGTLGTEMVVAAAPDGYTLVTAGAPLTVHKALIKNHQPNADRLAGGEQRRPRDQSGGDAGQLARRADRRRQGQARLLQLFLARGGNIATTGL
jgi:hypothetical protein